MCVIMYKPKGVAMPAKAVLRECFFSNPDGSGFMYPADGRVVVRKGLMTFDALCHALDKTDLTDVPLVVHFRIGTQGPNDASNCHPFPVTRNDKALAAKNSKSDVALVHNGIIPLTSQWGQEHSDTYLFVRDYVTGIIRSVRYWKDLEAVRVLGLLAKSKLAIMGSDGHVELIGAFEKHAGCYFSNSSYRRAQYFGRTTPNGTYPLFEEEEEWSEL